MTTEEKVFLLAELLGQLVSRLDNFLYIGFDVDISADYYTKQLDKIMNGTYS